MTPPMTAWSFRGTALSIANNVRVRNITGGYTLPPLRGANFATPGMTGEIFVSKIHGGRVIALELTIIDQPAGTVQTTMDALNVLFANRAQGALVYTDPSANTRTAQAECVSWDPMPIDGYAGAWQGVAKFYLADPWLYGTTSTTTVTPNAGLAFDLAHAVQSNISSATRTSYALALSGITSGQPILVGHFTQDSTTGLSSITDTFATPYTWTAVEQAHTYQNAQLYIGTGGVGTSGTITVNSANLKIGGLAVPFMGASTAAGLGAVDVHGNQSVASLASVTLSLATAAAGEGILFAGVRDYPANMGLIGPGGASYGASLSYLDDPLVVLSYGWTNTTSGAFTPTWTTAPSGTDMVACAVKASGTPLSFNVTNSGSATAEKISLDVLGPLYNPTITNTTTGTSLTITTSVLGTKHLLVDCSAMTATNDGANVIGSVTHSGAAPFLTLAPGVNAMTISGAGATAATRLTVSFQPPYV